MTAASMAVGFWGTLPLAAAAAAADRSTPALAPWVKEVADREVGVPRRLVFLRGLPAEDGDDLTFLPVVDADFNRAGFFQTVSTAHAAWDFKLNRQVLAAQEVGPMLRTLTAAEILVMTPPSEPWSVTVLRGGGRSDKALTARPPKSQAPAALVAWVHDLLGWDGIVLDQKGDYLLVAAPAALLQESGLQALAVRDSHRRFGLSPAERRGAGLLSMVEAKGAMAIFEIVFLGQGTKALPAGTKLLIQKKSRG